MSHSNLPVDADTKLLSHVRIAAPCNVDWDSMTGDERKRFCGQCKLNVYNISEMSTKEAANLIRKTEGRACLRLYRRQDGTIITDNCPVGLRKVRDRIMKVAAIVTAQLVVAGLLSSDAQGCEPIAVRETGAPPPPPALHITAGIPAPMPPRVLMGSVAPMYTPQANPIAEFGWLLNAASLLSSIGLIVLALLKKTRPSTIGLMLLAIWGFTGFILGVMTAFRGYML